MKKNIVTILLVISVALFFTSLALPAFETNVTYMGGESRTHEPNKSYFGYEAYFLGWASIFYGTFPWVANVGYWLTIVLIRIDNKLSLPISIMTLLVALSSLTHPTIERGERGYDFYISGFNSGFYLWLGAIVFSCASSLAQQTSVKNK